MQQFWQEFLIIAAAHLIAVIGPGPDFAITTKYAIKYGKRIGTFTAIGIGVAIMLHVTYALLGFSLFVSKNAVVFNIVKYLGAAYLLYLAYLSFRSKPRKPQLKITEKALVLDTISPKDAFLTGFFTNALNIKAMLFFLTMFTAIISTTTPTSHKLIYGLWMSLTTFLWFTFVAHVFGNERVKQTFTRKAHIIDYIMGVIFVGFAIYLIVGK